MPTLGPLAADKASSTWSGLDGDLTGMSGKHVDALMKVLEAALVLAESDPEAMAKLDEFAQQIVEKKQTCPGALEESAPIPGPQLLHADPAPKGSSPQITPVEEVSEPPVTVSADQVQQLKEHFMEGAALHEYTQTPLILGSHVDPIDSLERLQALEQAALLKEAACQWALERRRLIESGDRRMETEVRTRELIQSAEEANVYLWMLRDKTPNPENEAKWQRMCQAFHVVAKAALLLRKVLASMDNESDLRHAMEMAAEAQASLRSVVGEINEREDPTQKEFYWIIRPLAAEFGIYLVQLQLGNQGAEDLQGLLDRIQLLQGEIDLKLQKRQKVQYLSKALEKRVARLSQNASANAGAWEEIARLMDDLVNLGVRPNSRWARKLLLSRLEEIPLLPKPHPGFEEVVREIIEFSEQPQKTEYRMNVEKASPDMAKVRQLVEGRKVLIIGGERRELSRTALRDAFAAEDVEWIETTPHQSYEAFRPSIADPAVAVVLLLIRFSSHSFGEISGVCESYGKPLVRLPGGYGVNTVAKAILEQAGQRLLG